MSAVNKLPLPDDNDDGQLPRPKHTLCGYNCFRCSFRIVLTLAATASTIYVCMLSSERYFKYWVQMTIERTDVHVSEVPFPGVTICFTMNHYNMNRTDETRLSKLSNIVDNVLWRSSDGVRVTPADFTEFEDLSDYPLDSLHQPNQFELKCEDLFTNCSWRHITQDCCTILKPSFISNTCFAFNTHFVKDPVSTWPWSTAGSGKGSALNLKINRHVHNQRVKSVGVIIQESDQYLGSSVILTKDNRIIFPLQPLRFTADPAVRARPAEMRRCFFPDEQQQSRSDCIHTCHKNYISQKCECSLNWSKLMIRASNNDTLRKCTVTDIPCLYKYRLTLFSVSNIIETSEDNEFTTIDCKCFPNCDRIQYHTIIYTDNQRNSENNDSYVEIDAFYQEETLFSYRSTLYVTFVDLMVSYGGIAALFLGISFVGTVNAILNRISCCNEPKHTTEVN